MSASNSDFATAAADPSTDSEQLREWLTQSGDGNQQAFAQLYQATSSHLFALLLRMLKQPELAEDALQDCYARIWKKAESYTAERGAPMAWLMTIARYRAIDLLRQQRSSQRPTVSLDEPPEAAVAMADTAMHATENTLADTENLFGLEKVGVCMEQLSADQRQTLLLSYYEGYSHSELSERLEQPIGTVKSWVRRGLQALRQCLKSLA